jgi:hypothetical protein
MNRKFNNRSKERHTFWTKTIQVWEESNLTQAEYCRKNSLDEQLFSKWKIRLYKSNKKDLAKFVEIKPDPEDIISVRDDIELIIKDVYKIKIKPDFDRENLKRILSILGGEK